MPLINCQLEIGAVIVHVLNQSEQNPRLLFLSGHLTIVVATGEPKQTIKYWIPLKLRS